MLHHASFNARNPRRVAAVLAELLGATAVRAPSPPFPDESWFVCYGDEAGSFVEVIPWGTVLDPDAPAGVGRDEAMRERAGFHVLLHSPLSAEEVAAVAARESWRLERVDARLFQVVKVWVENTALIELLTPEIAPAYLATFGRAGIRSLDGKLRELETALKALKKASEPA